MPQLASTIFFGQKVISHSSSSSMWTNLCYCRNLPIKANLKTQMPDCLLLSSIKYFGDTRGIFLGSVMASLLSALTHHQTMLIFWSQIVGDCFYCSNIILSANPGPGLTAQLREGFKKRREFSLTRRPPGHRTFENCLFLIAQNKYLILSLTH